MQREDWESHETGSHEIKEPRTKTWELLERGGGIITGYILKPRGRGLELLYSTGKETRTPKGRKRWGHQVADMGITQSLKGERETCSLYIHTHNLISKQILSSKNISSYILYIGSDRLVRTPFNHTVNAQQGSCVPAWLNDGGSRHLPSQHFTPPKNIQKTNWDRRTDCPADEKKWSQLRALVTGPAWGWAGRRFRWDFHILWRNKFLSDARWFLEKQSSCSLSFILDWKRKRERQGEHTEKNLQERADGRMYRIPALPGM